MGGRSLHVEIKRVWRQDLAHGGEVHVSWLGVQLPRVGRPAADECLCLP